MSTKPFVLATALLVTVACKPSDDAVVRAKPGWAYLSSEDDMRKTKSFFATITSSNSPTLAFPYKGGSPVALTLSKDSSEKIPDKMPPAVELANGQFNCGPDECQIAMKVDDEALIEVTGQQYQCGSHQCLFLTAPGPLANRSEPLVDVLRHSKRLILELPLYRYGPYQYYFDTAGLKWSKQNDRQ